MAVADASYVYTTTKSKPEPRVLDQVTIVVSDVALSRAGFVVNLAVGPVVPEHPIFCAGRAVDQALAVLPRHIYTLCVRGLQLVGKTAAVVL